MKFYQNESDLHNTILLLHDYYLTAYTIVITLLYGILIISTTFPYFMSQIDYDCIEFINYGTWQFKSNHMQRSRHATFTTEGGPPELCGVTGICPALSIVPIAQADKCCSESIPVARAYITAQQIHIKAINKLCPIMYKHKLAIWNLLSFHGVDK